jgi:hypothetical protein
MNITFSKRSGASYGYADAHQETTASTWFINFDGVAVGIIRRTAAGHWGRPTAWQASLYLIQIADRTTTFYAPASPETRRSEPTLGDAKRAILKAWAA